MTYLPKSSGSEEETTEQVEELEVGKDIFVAEKPSKCLQQLRMVTVKMNVRNHKTVTSVLETEAMACILEVVRQKTKILECFF